jgi:hypothetical protein
VSKLEAIEKLIAEATPKPGMTRAQLDDQAFELAAASRELMPKMLRVCVLAREALHATLLHDWKPLEDALAALETP